MRDNRDVFAEAKRVACGEIAKAAGVELKRSGNRLIGACPLCGGDKGSTRFSISIRENLWVCYGCGDGGSSIDLEMEIGGGTALEAAMRLAGDDARIRVAPALTPVGTATRPHSTAPMAARLWREAKPARGSIVESWFAARGIDPALIAAPLERLRFHPNAFAAGERGITKWTWIKSAPALIAPVIDTSDTMGRLIGVHATYLSADGSDKANLKAPNGDDIPSRKMWGKTQGGVCALTPLKRFAEVSASSYDPPLFVGEGLETTLSAFAYWQQAGRDVRAAAVLSLDNLQGHWAKDDDGAAKHWPPRADANRPPWTLSKPGRVIGIVDRDMAAINIKWRDETGAVKRKRLDAEARAQLCGDLFVQAWRNAGADSVDITMPAAAGRDLNDMMRNV